MILHEKATFMLLATYCAFIRWRATREPGKDPPEISLVKAKPVQHIESLSRMGSCYAVQEARLMLREAQKSYYLMKN
jgi:hypothetical protein